MTLEGYDASKMFTMIHLDIPLAAFSVSGELAMIKGCGRESVVELKSSGHGATNVNETRWSRRSKLMLFENSCSTVTGCS